MGIAEHAVFHGSPLAALGVITSAMDVADQIGLVQPANTGHGDMGHGDMGHGDTGHGDTGHGDTGPQDVTGQRAVLAWLHGVALGAAGDFGPALDVLTTLLAPSSDTPRARLVVAYAAAASASVHRQLGRVSDAAALDAHGLAAAEPLGDPALEATLDCLVGLASDAVGLGDPALAHERITELDTRIDAAGTLARWRPRCRLDWARAEVATAAGDGAGARAAAAAALASARAEGAPRHEAKSLLYLGLAELAAGDAAGAVHELRACAVLAGELGALPLSWRAAALLGALTAGSDPAGSREWMMRAADEVARITAAVPATLLASWLARPDVAAVSRARS